MGLGWTGADQEVMGRFSLSFPLLLGLPFDVCPSLNLNGIKLCPVACAAEFAVVFSSFWICIPIPRSSSGSKLRLRNILSDCCAII
jgi:hypothetical protein